MVSGVLSSILLFAAASAATNAAMLHTAAELNAFANDVSRRYTPFCVTGTVQDVHDRNVLVFNDASGWTEIINLSGSSVNPGDRVSLTGRAHMSSHQEPDLVANAVEILGTDAVASPVRLALGELTEERHHLRTIVSEGTVIDVFADEVDPRNRFLILKDRETVMPVALQTDPAAEEDLERLRGARIRITGRFLRTASGIRKYSGPFIAANGTDEITVTVPAPDDPLAAPPLEKNLYRTPREIAGSGKRSVTGTVLAVWDDNRLMVRSDDRRIVNVTLAHGQSAPPPGASVTAAGYPETDLFRVNLSRAVVRIESPSAAESDETAVTDLSALYYEAGGIDPRSHGRLLRVRGTVRSVPTRDSRDRRLLLTDGPHRLSVDLGPCPDLADDLELGTVLEVTGRCLHEIDSWNPDDIFPRIRDLVLVIRTPEDLRTVARPSWWTPLRLLVVISVLLAALIGVYIWNRILQKLVNRRGRELYREQVAHAIAEFKTGERTRLAVELHDSLSQTLGGIACQVAAGAKTIDRNPEVARRCIEAADKMLNSCRTELRQCLFDLRSDTLEEPDFSTAIRKTLDQLDGDTAIAIRFNVPRARLKDTTAHAILAIIRELTGNAIRHGGATDVKVAGAVEPGRILFSVRDNGRGFDPGTCDGPMQGHFGLEGIRNRIMKLNGTFVIESKPGAGAKAVITVPLPQIKNEKQ